MQKLTERTREFDEMDEQKSERAPQITVVLTPELAQRVKAAAARKGLKPSVLMRMWVIEKLQEDERGSRP